MNQVDILVPKRIFSDISRGMVISKGRLQSFKDDLAGLIAPEFAIFTKFHKPEKVKIEAIYNETPCRMEFGYSGKKDCLCSITKDILWFLKKFGKPEKLFIKLRGFEFFSLPGKISYPEMDELDQVLQMLTDDMKLERIEFWFNGTSPVSLMADSMSLGDLSEVLESKIQRHADILREEKKIVADVEVVLHGHYFRNIKNIINV